MQGTCAGGLCRGPACSVASKTSITEVDTRAGLRASAFFGVFGACELPLSVTETREANRWPAGTWHAREQLPGRNEVPPGHDDEPPAPSPSVAPAASRSFRSFARCAWSFFFCPWGAELKLGCGGG